MIDEWFIERTAPDAILTRLDEWKALRADGWNVHVLVEERRTRGGGRQSTGLVAMGYRGGRAPRTAPPAAGAGGTRRQGGDRHEGGGRSSTTP